MEVNAHGEQILGQDRTDELLVAEPGPVNTLQRQVKESVTLIDTGCGQCHACDDAVHRGAQEAMEA